MDSYSDFVGTNVRKLRDRLGMTQEEFADLSGVSREQISRIENGKEKIISKSLRKIAAATGINVRLLMAGLDSGGGISVGEYRGKYGGASGDAPSIDELVCMLDRAHETAMKIARRNEAAK